MLFEWWKAIGVGCRVGRNGLVGCWTERRRSPAQVMSWEPVCETVWRSGGLVVVSRFLKSAIQMNFAENQSWPARRLGRAAGWESPGGPIRETAPGGAQGELQGRQSQVGRGGSVLVLLLLAFDVCIHSVVWSVVRLVRQKVTLTLIVHALMRSVGGHVIGHVLL